MCRFSTLPELVYPPGRELLSLLPATIFGHCMVNLVENLQRLYLCEEEFVDAKTLLDVPKITAKEKKILEEWLEKDYLKVINAGNRQLYGLSDGGRRFLQQHNPQRWIELQQEKRRYDNEQLRALLELIRNKVGQSPLTPVEQKKFARYIDISLVAKTIEKTGENQYRLTEAGEVKITSLRPLSEVLQEWESTLRAVEEEANSTTQVYNDFVYKFCQDSQAKGTVDKLFSRFAGHLKDALEGLEEFQRQVSSLELAGETKILLLTEIEAAKGNFQSRAQEIYEALARQQREWQEEEQKSLQEARQRLESEYQKIWQRLEELEKLYAQVASQRTV